MNAQASSGGFGWKQINQAGNNRPKRAFAVTGAGGLHRRSIPRVLTPARGQRHALRSHGAGKPLLLVEPWPEMTMRQ
ncbi:hypothetical protein GCM10007881_40520 [Mesorhizobium huakuii]|nr:hypothetical protein GCM10007881_40520 [Mesorhizobium huakuii]